MRIDEFAQELGFQNADALFAASEPVYEEAGLVTWFLTRLPDGRWATWDDAEIALDRVKFYATEKLARKGLAEDWEESQKVRGKG